METTLKKQTSKTKWTLDPSHSELAFKVRHMMITNVKGEFRKFDAAIVAQGADFSNAIIDVTVDAASIATRDRVRGGSRGSRCMSMMWRHCCSG